MKINIEYAGVKYAIEITEESYNLIRYGTNSDTKSKNYGERTEKVLGYFSTIGGAVNKIIKSSLSSIDEEITLKQYVERIEKARTELMELVNEKD